MRPERTASSSRSRQTLTYFCETRPSTLGRLELVGTVLSFFSFKLDTWISSLPRWTRGKLDTVPRGRRNSRENPKKGAPGVLREDRGPRTHQCQLLAAGKACTSFVCYWIKPNSKLSPCTTHAPFQTSPPNPPLPSPPTHTSSPLPHPHPLSPHLLLFYFRNRNGSDLRRRRFLLGQRPLRSASRLGRRRTRQRRRRGGTRRLVRVMRPGSTNKQPRRAACRAVGPSLRSRASQDRTPVGPLP